MEKLLTGKNRLAFEVSKQFVKRFLSLEKKVLKEGHQVKILGTELALETFFTVPGIDFPIKIKGIVDRIDLYNGTIQESLITKQESVKASRFKSIKF